MCTSIQRNNLILLPFQVSDKCVLKSLVKWNYHEKKHTHTARVNDIAIKVCSLELNHFYPAFMLLYCVAKWPNFTGNSSIKLYYTKIYATKAKFSQVQTKIPKCGWEILITKSNAIIEIMTQNFSISFYVWIENENDYEHENNKIAENAAFKCHFHAKRFTSHPNRMIYVWSRRCRLLHIFHIPFAFCALFPYILPLSPYFQWHRKGNARSCCFWFNELSYLLIVNKLWHFRILGLFSVVIFSVLHLLYFVIFCAELRFSNWNQSNPNDKVNDYFI